MKNAVKELTIKARSIDHITDIQALAGYIEANKYKVTDKEFKTLAKGLKKDGMELTIQRVDLAYVSGKRSKATAKVEATTQTNQEEINVNNAAQEILEQMKQEAGGKELSFEEVMAFVATNEKAILESMIEDTAPMSKSDRVRSTALMYADYNRTAGDSTEFVITRAAQLLNKYGFQAPSDLIERLALSNPQVRVAKEAVTKKAGSFMDVLKKEKASLKAHIEAARLERLSK